MKYTILAVNLLFIFSCGGQIVVPTKEKNEITIKCKQDNEVLVCEYVKPENIQVVLRGPKGDTGPQGEMGPVGLQGEKGAPGINGLPGLQGKIGPQGPIGPQGVPGTVGPMGRTGRRGPMGLMGQRGPRGNIGPRGATGLNGEDGTSCTVTQVAEGALIECTDGTYALIEHGTNCECKDDCKKPKKEKECSKDKPCNNNKKEK